ncbi:MAG: Lrp/AsnC ligand binding domain-containing protein [Euryarchaeota archaeon]|nr:Lrp/AsnC ligand binding domain-containing protein [Euryarchaeota archaeon]
MVHSYVLITVAIGKVQDVLEQIKDMKDVEDADAVTGPYDLIARVKADDLGELTKTIIQNIHYIDGVIDTTTAIVIDV